MMMKRLLKREKPTGRGMDLWKNWRGLRSGDQRGSTFIPATMSGEMNISPKQGSDPGKVTVKGDALVDEWAFQAEPKVTMKMETLQKQAEIELLTPKPSGLRGSLQAVVQRVRHVRKERDYPSHEEKMLGRLEHVFSEMHKEFDERERILDKKLQQVVEERKLELQRFKWMSVPIGILSAIGIVYIFYVVYVMEGAMSNMSSNMTAMTGDISVMSENTGSMSENMTNVTAALGNMDYNMAHMTNDVSRMNGSMTSMSRSIQPIGQAANSAAPMMGMMRHFMPF